MAINVPRVVEVTGKKSVEEQRAEREWQQSRKFQQGGPKYGKLGAGMAWRRQVEKTRSF